MPPVIKKVLFGVSLLVLATFLFLYFFPVILFNIPLFPKEYNDYKLGITFSAYYTRDVLKLNVVDTYRALLDDLGARYVRIPVYWTDIEKEEGIFDFSLYDRLIALSRASGAKIVFVVGRKLPRWPECFVPEWARTLDENQQQEKILNMIETIIGRYKSETIIEAWQVENEPFFELFGECPDFDEGFYDRELALVRSLDNRKIIITDSGELGWWFGAARRADIFGTTLYRSVWNKYFKHISYPLPPAFYAFKRSLTGIFFNPSEYWVMELQAEPFAPVPLPDYSIDRQLRLMNPKRLYNNISFSKATGFSRSYIWGVEWWYWLKTKGYSDMWDAGKELFKQ